MKIEYIQRPETIARSDSFWFDGQVAIVSHNGKNISVEATGHIQVTFKVDGKTFENDMARKEAKRLKLFDKGLNKLGSHDGWGNNNWFGFYDLDKEEWLVETSTDYADAIAIAKQICG